MTALMSKKSFFIKLKIKITFIYILIFFNFKGNDKSFLDKHHKKIKEILNEFIK